MTTSEVEYKRKFIEYLILLIIGDNDKEISLLHIQKEIFLLCNFNEEIKNLYQFVKHYRGPYLDLISESVREPFFLINCWNYFQIKNTNKAYGGFLKITSDGSEEYEKFIEKAKKSSNLDIMHIINAITILNRLYGTLDYEELLLLIYTEFPEFTEKSEEYSKIVLKKEKIAKRLLKKNAISEGKYEELLE